MRNIKTDIYRGFVFLLLALGTGYAIVTHVLGQEMTGEARQLFLKILLADAVIIAAVLLGNPLKRLLEKKRIFSHLVSAALFAGAPYFILYLTQITIMEEYLLVEDYLTYSVILYLLIEAALFFLLGSARGSASLLLTLSMLLGMVSYFVEDFRGKPAMVIDVMGIGTAATVASTYTIVFSLRLIHLLQGFLLIFVLVWQFQSWRLSGRRIFWAVRTAGTVASVLVFGLFYRNVLCNDFMEAHDFWNLNKVYSQKGFVATLAAEVDFMHVVVPEDYSVEKVSQIAQRADEKSSEILLADSRDSLSILEDNSTRVTPENLIVIMNESFFDPAFFSEPDTDSEMLPFWRSLSENTVRGNLFVPVFGAGTANSEYEVLTSNHCHFLPNEIMAYETYIQDPEYGLAYTLKQQGYSTTALHPNLSYNWNRAKVYPKMGFDTFVSQAEWGDCYDQVRKYISDQSCFDKIIEETSGKKDGEKKFVFCVTMQNHGGYTESSLGDYVPKVSLNYDSEMPKAETYLSLINDTDTAFEKLIEHYQNSDEPTMIVMFGDHQPKIEQSFYNELKEARIGESVIPELEQKFVSQYVIWTNYEQAEDEKDMSANYLGAYVLQRAGLQLTTYEKFALQLMNELPVVGCTAVCDKNGNWYDYDRVPYRYKLMLQNYHYMQYNEVFDRENTLENVFSLPDVKLAMAPVMISRELQ